VVEALPKDAGLTPMKGFKLDFSANPGFRKVFFSAHCDCGTAALLSVEIAGGKTAEEIRQALPSLVSRLETQAKSFRMMSCEMHQRMSLGAGANRKQA